VPLVLLQARLGRGLGGALLGLQRRDLAELPFDLAAALPEAVLALGQLEVLELALVVALLERRAGGAQLREPLVVLAQRMLQPRQPLPLFLDLLLAPPRLLAQGLDLALPREDAAVGGVRRVEAHPEAAELMAFSVHQHDVRAQPHAGE